MITVARGVTGMEKRTEDELKPVRRRKKKVKDDLINKEKRKKKVKQPSIEPVKPEKHTHEKRNKKQNKRISIVILCAEILVFCGVLYGLIYFSLKLKNEDFLTEDVGETEVSENSATDSGSINIDNDSFSLVCTKVQLTTDMDGNPAALIYFTFTNKTATPLSLSEVFPPAVQQDGVDCETFAPLDEPPDEFYNKDIQIQDGASIEACYSVELQNTTSALTLTIHDNYETFTDIASTVIQLSQ